MIANDQRSASAIRARRRDCVHRGDPTLTLREGVSEGTRTPDRLATTRSPQVWLDLKQPILQDFRQVASDTIGTHWYPETLLDE